MTSVNHFVVTIELSQTYLDTALVKALKELSVNREVVKHHCNLQLTNNGYLESIY